MSEQEQPMPGDLLDAAYHTPIGSYVLEVLEVLYQADEQDYLPAPESLLRLCPLCNYRQERLIAYRYYNPYLDVKCSAAWYCEDCMLVWHDVNVGSYYAK